MVRIGLTGGIGSGKSTVARAFEALGAAIYQADLRAKELMSSDRGIIAELTELLGPETYSDGRLNRAWIASQVFDNKELLSRMNAIVHPRVAEDFEQFSIFNFQFSIIILEAAILLESGFERFVDRVVTVDAPVEQRVARAAARDGVTPENIRLRMANQMSDEERSARADFVIDNSDGVEVLPQILKLYQQLLHEA